MRLVLLIVITLAITFVQLKALTLDQVRIAQQSYAIGAPYNLGHSLAAIALVESQLGIYQINAKSADYGIHQVHIKSHLAHIDIKDTQLNRSKYATKLITDSIYCANAALRELLYWKVTRKRSNYIRYISSYNQGSRITNYDYVRKVSAAIRQLRTARIIP